MSKRETLLYPLGSQDIDPRLAASIKFLAIKQREEQESQPPLSDNLASRKKIFSWFKESEAFGQIYNHALRYFVVPRTDREIEACRSDIAGEVFQQIAFTYLSQKLAAGQTLLSPERTFDLYNRSLYPEKKVVRHPIGTSSLLGISVPDGLLVENEPFGHGIIAAVEYTLEGKRDYFENKIVHFKGDQERFPSLFQNSQLLFVTPTFRHWPYYGQQSGVKIRQLPFTHHQFRNFSSWIYQHHRPHQNILVPDDASATLREVQDRVREQRKASIDQFSSHPG